MGFYTRHIKYVKNIFFWLNTMIFGYWAMTLTEMLCEDRCALPAVSHHSFFS